MAREVEQKTLDYLSEYLLIKYEVINNTNSVDNRSCEAQITLTNSGTQPIQQGKWFIYFYHFRMIERQSLVRHGFYFFKDAGLRLEHVNGVLFRLGPDESFKDLAAGDSLELPFTAQHHVIARSDLQPNWYVAAKKLKPRVLKSTVGESLNFVAKFDTKAKWKRNRNDLYNPLTPEKRFQEYQLNPGVDPKLVIPTPMSVERIDDQSYIIDSTWKVISDSEKIAQFLMDKMGLSLCRTKDTAKCIVLEVTGGATKEDENYNLCVDEQPSIRITATSSSGLFYGVQTLLSLHAAGTIPRVKIVDKPRFSYRGMHLDVARNFVQKQEVMKLLDTMAMFKMNRLHLHLTDDEGWRIEIPGLPELIKVGARRRHTEVLDSLLPQLGSGPNDDTSGSGYYSVTDYRDILAHAQLLHIQVIPEIDMPGHCHAAIRSMEARYKKYEDADSVRASEYRLIEPDDEHKYMSVQLFCDDVLNPALDSTYNFIAKVLDELIEMHKPVQPLQVFHYGGDEVSLAWSTSPACQRLVGDSNISEEEAHHIVMQHFVHKVAQMTAERGLKLGCWEDGAMHDDDTPYDLARLGTKGDVYSNAWMNIWEASSASRAYKLANAGYKVIMSQATHLYFDHPYEPDPEERGLYWATRCIDLRKTFGFLPEDLYSNADVSRMGHPIKQADVCKGDAEPLKTPDNIIGMQAHLWTETVRTVEQLDNMVWPRLVAVAERAWHRADWERETDSERRLQQLNRDWTSFAAALGSKEMKRLEATDVLYRIPPPGARLNSSGCVEMCCSMPGLPLQYESKDEWHDYTEPFKPSSNHVKLRTRSHDMKRTSRIVQLNCTDDS